MNKKSIIIIIITLLLIVGLAYNSYVFYQKWFVSKAQLIQNKPLILNKSEKIIKSAEAVGSKVKNLFKEGRTGSLVNLSVKYTYQGTFDKLEATNQLVGTDYPFDAALVFFFTTSNNKKMEYYYSQADLAKIEYLKKVGNDLQTIDPKEFTSGDKIELIQEEDLLKPPKDNLIKAQIIKNL
jgi:hypothetical protein